MAKDFVGKVPQTSLVLKENPLVLSSPIIPVSFRSFDMSISKARREHLRGARLCYKLEDPMCVEKTTTLAPALNTASKDTSIPENTLFENFTHSEL